MAFTRSRHWNRTSTMLLFVTFLSLLYVSEGRRCYWCGPLADQVHRSRRAPPCLTHGNQMAACEPGRDHCAVVATAPPHVESRFCVKIYQDECYPLFCNTTQSWKMVCPCRGDLCNGANGDRENEAFTYLAKLAARTQNFRLRRDTSEELTMDRPTTSYQIKNETENNNDIENLDKNVQESEPILVNVGHAATTASNLVTELKIQDITTESQNDVLASSTSERSLRTLVAITESITKTPIKTEPSDEPLQANSAPIHNQLPTSEIQKDILSAPIDNNADSLAEKTIENNSEQINKEPMQNDGTSNTENFPLSIPTSSVIISTLNSNSDYNYNDSKMVGNSAGIIETSMADEPIRTTVQSVKETNSLTAEARQEHTLTPYETTKVPNSAEELTSISANKTTITKHLTTKSPENSSGKFTSHMFILIIKAAVVLSIFS